MIELIKNIKKEKCSSCFKNVSAGHVVVICKSCDEICHKKCSKTKNYTAFRENSYCQACIMKNDIIKYNPFYSLLQDANSDNFFDDESPEYTENVQALSDILETCKSYTTKEFCNLRNSINEQQLETNNFPFSTYFENIDGNHSNFDKFAAKMGAFDHNFSIIGLAETNVDENSKGLYSLGNNYTPEYSSKLDNKSKGSGLALYINNAYNYTVIEELNYSNSNIESLFVRLTNTAVPITVGVIYRSPNGDLNAFNSEFDLILSKVPVNNCYILGDYNVNLHSLTTKLEQEHEEKIITNGFFPLISIATHQQSGCKKSCIDNIMTNQNPQNIAVSGKLSSSMSTHGHSGIFQISTNIGCDEKKAPEKISIEYEYSYDNIKKFTNLLECKLNEKVKSYDNFSEYIQKFEFGISEIKDAESKFENFMTIFKSCIDDTCKLAKPKLTKRNKLNNPWITAGIIKSITTNDNLYQKWLDSFKTFELGDDNLKIAHRSHQKTLRWVIKNARKKYYSEKFERSKGNKKKTWQVINEIRGKEKLMMKPSFLIDNEQIFTRRIIADKFNKYFVELASKLNQDAYGDIPITAYPSFESYLSSPSNCSIFLEDTDTNEVTSIITELETGKSSDIPIVIVKSACNLIAPYISILINKCISCGVFPSIFKLSKITPVFKKDNKELIKSYRPISTLPIFGKIFEKVIYSRIYRYLTSEGILTDSQFGFRKGYSTVHAIHHSVNLINEQMKNRKHVMGIFIDLSKAFDTLDHRLLIKKLDNYGIRGKANDLLKSYLSDRKQYTSVLGVDSSVESILYGVPQGSVLGPLLFLIYINDITNSIKHISGVELVLYADDTNIFVSDENKQSLISKANKILRCINSYMKSNMLHVNIDKCCYIHFKPKVSRNEVAKDEDIEENNSKVNINGIEIPEVESTKYLGITIDNNLCWLPHIETLHKKLKSVCGMIKRMITNIPSEHYKSLYYALFESHLSYCITVFGNANKNTTDRLFTTQKHCIRILFGDLEAFIDKHSTCCRTRPLENQRLDHKFYCKEHTKPLFNEHKILSMKNLYNYQTCIETFKIIKFKYPKILYSLFFLSTRNNESLLMSQPNSSSFTKDRTQLWNSCMKLIFKNDTLHDISISTIKHKLKDSLLKVQNAFDSVEWYSHLNSNLETLNKL